MQRCRFVSVRTDRAWSRLPWCLMTRRWRPWVESTIRYASRTLRTRGGRSTGRSVPSMTVSRRWLQPRALRCPTGFHRSWMRSPGRECSPIWVSCGIGRLRVRHGACREGSTCRVALRLSATRPSARLCRDCRWGAPERSWRSWPVVSAAIRPTCSAWSWSLHCPVRLLPMPTGSMKVQPCGPWRWGIRRRRLSTCRGLSPTGPRGSGWERR